MFELSILGSEIKILFYIIIGIAYLFYKMYNKELKKQNEKRMGQKPVGKRSAEEIFRELQKSLGLPDDTSQENNKPIVVQNRTVKERKIEDKATRANNIFASEGQSKMKHYKPIQASKLKRRSIRGHEPELPAIVDKEYGPEIHFDPRQAVIFSEILKRKEY